MLIDCETCVAPPDACRDCVITALLERPPVPVEFDEDEASAIGSLVHAGLLPPLRLASGSSRIGREIA